MGRINITEQVHRVDVQEGVVRVSTIGVAGPPGPEGPPGDLDLEELNQIVNSAVEGHSDRDTGVHGVGESTVASTDDVTAAQGAAQDYADSAVGDHNAATNVHGVDTTQLATQEDLDNLDVLPEPGEDGDVLTLADGEPTWAEPEGGGLDPDGPEVITGDWLFDRENLRVGANSRLAVGIDTECRLSSSVAIGVDAYTGGQFGTAVGYQAGENASGNAGGYTAVGARAAQNHRSIPGSYGCYVGFQAGMRTASRHGVGIGAHSLEDTSGESPVAVGYATGYQQTGAQSIMIGSNAGYQQTGAQSVMIGSSAGHDNVGDLCTLIGRGSGRHNTRDNRLIIDTAESNSGNLTDPLIDGRFHDGTDDDGFEYSKGLKVNGHLEATDQLILRSPNGTRWAITVDDEGNLSTAPATEEITP